MPKGLGKIVLTAIFLLSWFGLGLQFYLMFGNAEPNQPAWEIILNFFSFFTILTNLLVAISSSFLLFSTQSKQGKFFSSPGNRTAIAVYISIVGIVYSLVLRKLWHPTGWQLLADRILHDIIPVLYVIFWFISVPAKSVKWQQIFKWLISPVIYCAYALMRGLLSHWYPYPFLDVHQLGAMSVALNIIVLTLGFIFISMIYVSINQFIKKESN